jgi:hypothetical protein
MKISAKKGILIGGGAIVAAVIIVIIIVLVGLDDIVKTAVERAGSDVTKVEVTLNEADVSPTEGKAALRGLVIGNPAEFKTDSAFALGEISVALDIGSIGDDTLLIQEIVVDRPQVTYELGENGSNIEAIQRNVESQSKGGGKSSSGDDTKIIIDHLYIRNGKVRISAAPLGGKTMDSNLPEIHLTDLGKEEGGASPEQIAEKIMAAVTSNIGGFVGGLDISSVFEGMQDVPAALKDLAGGAIGEASKAVENVSDGLLEGVMKNDGDKSGGALDSVKDSIGSVLGD